LFIVIAGGAAFDQIPEFVGKALGAALFFVVVGGLIYAFCSPAGKARTRFWTTVVFSIYCATFPLKEYARRAPERAQVEGAVAAFDRGTGALESQAAPSPVAPPNPVSSDDVVVALMEKYSIRSSDRQSRYAATLSSIDLDDAVNASRISSEEGRADALARLARFDQAVAEFASSQDEDMNWIAAQLVEWNVAAGLSSKIVAGMERGREKTVPRLMRWLAIQHERASAMREVVNLSGDADHSALQDRLAALASEEEQLGRAQLDSNQQVRERLSRK